MSDSTSNEVKHLLLAALQRPTGERIEFVIADSSAPEAVKSEVIRLIEAEAENGAAIEKLLEGGITEFVQGTPLARAGPYTIVRTIGHGGMATVYLARKEGGLADREVALKVFDVGHHGPKAQERFERELKALAKLEHPNIVRLYDVGVTPEGYFYLAMEYVDGANLHDHCSSRGLSMLDRLRLFEQICQGVAFANLKLIVHLDLKPSNTLVSATGIAKVVDFSIAKLLRDDQRAVATTRSLSIQYSSPEQVKGEEISVASDVYSLGVNLYELILGSSPCGNWGGDLSDLTDAIVNRDPILPRAINRAIPDDLEAIILRALRKQPEERYRSVDALIEDLGHFLRGEPVTAHRGNRVYRLRKFVGRNRLPIAAGVLIMASVGIGLIASLHYARSAGENLNDAARLAEDVFLQLSVLNHSRDKPTALVIAKRSRDQLSALSHKYPQNHELRRRLLVIFLEIGELQGHPDMHSLGDSVGAMETFKQAVALGEELYAFDSKHYIHTTQLSRAHCALGTMLLDEGDIDSAAIHYERAAQLNRVISTGADQFLSRRAAQAAALMYLAEIKMLRNDLSGGLALKRDVIAIRREICAAEPQYVGHKHSLANDLQTYGASLARVGQLDQSLAAFKESDAVAAQVLEKQPSNPIMRTLLAETRAHVGRSYLKAGNNALAVKQFHDACERFRQLSEQEPLSASNSVAFASCLSWLAVAEQRCGFPRAADTARTAIQKAAESMAANPANKSIQDRVQVITQRARGVLGGKAAAMVSADGKVP